jgi:endonuclease YncB( thermonuclease family)
MRPGIGLSVLLALATVQAAAADLFGRVVSIADGDTITVLVDTTQYRIRLSDIDAPERRQPWGTRARQMLSSMVFSKAVVVKPQTIDRYGRTVGRVFADDLDVNAEMVRQGFAWVYRRYSKDVALLRLEEEARAAGRGLWSQPPPVPPWEWRRSR